MLSSVQVLEQVQKYLAGAIALDALEDWLVSSSWNMHQHADRDVQELVGAIELRLAEHSQGHLDDSDLEEELHMILLHGSKLPVAKMPLFREPSEPESAAVALSSTFQEEPPIQTVVFGGNIGNTSETWSASERTVTARELLEQAS